MSKLKAASSRWPLPPRTTAVLLVVAFLVVVSSALADEGAILRRNVSGTPDFETENAQLTMAQFYVDAQRANGTLVMDEDELEILDKKTGEIMPGALQYFAETDVPRDFSTQDDLLMDERTVAKPLVITYYDAVHEDDYVTDGTGEPVPENVFASIGGSLAKAVDDAFDAEALASGGVPDPSHRFDCFASVSFDDGETWKKYNLSESALRSSFTLKDGTVYPGTVDYGVKHAMAGNKILVVWHSKYAMQGSPRYSLKAWELDENGEFELDAEGEQVPVLDEWGDQMYLEYLGIDGEPIRFDDPDFATNVVYYDHPSYSYDAEGNPTGMTGSVEKPVPLDFWGVAGSQNSIDYTTWMHHGLFPFAEVGEVPFSSIWTARGVIQQTAKKDKGELVYETDENGVATDQPVMVWDVKWRKAERLTSGKRDAMYTAIDGAENAGFAIVWQEDPTGLRPGYGEGPGEGWSGSTAHHKTDLWYSYITWDDFDKVENPLGDDDYWTLEDNYLQTPEDIDALGWDVDTFHDPDITDTTSPDYALTTNKPQVFERMSMPQRITDNNNIVCLIDGKDPTESDLSDDPTDLVDVSRLSPVVGGSEDGIEKVVDLYAWLDLDRDENGIIVGNGTPDMVAGGFVWLNSQDRYICDAVTEDGRLLNGQQWSTRTRLMMEGYDRNNGDGTFTRSAWVLAGYEDSKGLGPGEPVKDEDGNQLEVQPEPADIGKVTKCDTFELMHPSFAKPGHIINAPDLGNPGYTIESVDEATGEITTVPPLTGLFPNDKGELQYATPISRRPALFVNPITKLELQDDGTYKGVVKLEPGMTSAVMLYKEGTMRQGGPADIFMRRWEVPDGYNPNVDNPFAIANLTVDLPDDYAGFPEVPVWEQQDDGSWLQVDTIAVDTDDPDGWDDEITTSGESRSAYPALEGFTSEYYPNGVMVRGAQNLSGTIPVDIRPQDSNAGDKPGASEVIPLWHLDIMPDLAVKVDDGTLSYTDCYSCHADSWGVNPDDPDGYPSHGILDRVWWWTQTDGTSAVNDKIMAMIPEGVTGEGGYLLTRDDLDAWGATQYDEHWKNPFDLSKGHRGHIDGQDVMVMFGYAPNWLQAHYGKEPINLFVRRSFDGGKTWTTTPGEGVYSLDGVEYGGVGTTYSQVQGVGSEDAGRVFFYDEIYEPGEFERMRNVSQFYSSSSTIIDPRYSPTNMRRQTDILRKLSLDQTEYEVDGTGYNPETGRFYFEQLPAVVDPTDGFTLPNADAEDPDSTDGVRDLSDEEMAAARPDDIRDPSKFFAVYESGDSSPMREGYEADAENLFYSRATQWGDVWEEIVWYPSENNPNEDAVEYPYWDWLENAQEDKSGEAAIAGSPGGQFMYSTWNQWAIYEGDEHEHEFDAIFRRSYWLPDILEPLIQTVADVDELIVEEPVPEGDDITLTATSTYTIGGEPVSQERLDSLDYAWDLDANGSFETLGQTVTMVSTGAMQNVVVRAVDRATGADAVDFLTVNSAANTPRVWNVKLVKGVTGLAGAKVALSANFRSPGLRWSHPAPAEYDSTVGAVIDWGDGTIEAGTIASKNDGKGSARFVTGTHKYGKPGLYTVKVTVTNAYGNSGWDFLRYAVIVHRKAGALAMAGTFTDLNGEGDASIAANVKYKLKAKNPSGKVLFTLGGYDFLVSVCDDRQNKNDLVRVKIWKANGKMATVIYDSQPGSPDEALAITPLTSGKITIPLFKGKSWKYYLAQKK